MTPEYGCRAWAEIDGSALTHNITTLQQRYGDGGRTRIMAIVKANAYGHDVSLVAPLCFQAGLRDFGVATVQEGISLRRLLPGTTIYLLGAFLSSEASEIIAHRLIPLVSDQEMGCALSQAGQRLGQVAEAHLDVDTGMGRSGVSVPEAPALLCSLDGLPNLRMTGLATHFARADEDQEDAQAQHALFSRLLEQLGERTSSLCIHAANSPATLVLPASVRYQIIRPGLLLYGIEPAPGMLSQGVYRPALSLKAQVTLCRPLPGGATVSYGKTYRVPPSGGMYATLGIGYGDGYPRRLSHSGSVLLHGRRVPICGRICMDQFVVDVSHLSGVRAGHMATVIGSDGTETITVGNIAAAIAATPHEITTCLTSRVPRRLIGGLDSGSPHTL